MSHFVVAMELPAVIRQIDAQSYRTGESSELGAIRETARALTTLYRESSALTYREAVLAEEFRSLASKWHEETRLDSSLTSITEHPSYRAIVALGGDIVPLLLNELRRGGTDPDFWFTALREVTGVDPIPAGHWGDIRAMAEDWLRWGRDRQIIR